MPDLFRSYRLGLNRPISTLWWAAIATLTLIGCSANTSPSTTTGWQLVYAHDDTGQATAGSKDGLLEAVRQGQPIRIHVIGKRIEHVADARFLSILEGEVFAQIGQIQSQSPSVDPPTITFREPGQYWRAIYSTTGSMVALMDGNEPRQRPVGLRWFAQH